MPFPDDDLKRLKDYIKTHEYEVTFVFDIEDIIGIIARLEAAEIVAESCWNDYQCANSMGFDTWRKAAGKS